MTLKIGLFPHAIRSIWNVKPFLQPKDKFGQIMFSFRSTWKSLTRDQLSCTGSTEAWNHYFWPCLICQYNSLLHAFYFCCLLSQQSRCSVQYVSINWVRSCPQSWCPELNYKFLRCPSNLGLDESRGPGTWKKILVTFNSLSK